MRKLLFSFILAGIAPLVLGNAGMSTPAVNVQNADFVAGKQAIERKDWKSAIEALSKAEKSMAGNADVQNYLGYAYRNLDELDNAFRHYKEALRIDPKHRGAHEYIGQTYLKAKQPDKANEHLAALEKICGKSCEEYKDLARSIANYGKGR